MEYKDSQKCAPGLVLAPAEPFERLTENDYVAPYDMRVTLAWREREEQ